MLFWNARARNTQVEEKLNLSFPAQVTAELAELKAAFASLEGGQAAVIAEVKKVLEDLARR